MNPAGCKKTILTMKSCIFFISLVILSLNLIYLSLAYRATYIIHYGATLTDTSVKSKYLSIYETLKIYENNTVKLYIVMCGLFILVFGIILIVQKISLKKYLLNLWSFFEIQITGTFLFSFLFNIYGLQNTFSGITTLLRQKITLILIILPVFTHFLIKNFKLLKKLFTG